MINASLHSQNQHQRLYPHIGLFADFNQLKFNIEYGRENIFQNTITDEKIELRLQYQIYDDNAFFIALSKHEINALSIGLKWYF
ncbi:MAG: hypothetical protein Q9M36_15655 [Sulfurovum sp.]|nr:hypothetical protein [Sulfurovum sp.]